MRGCKPRKEVLQGDLDDAIFAADFGNLISGNAPKVYKDAATFFQNTHPAAQLRKVTEVVFQHLADKKEGAEGASAVYHDLYQRVYRESPGVLPPAAPTTAYAKSIVECYPFHPRLLETALDRLGALQEGKLAVRLTDGRAYDAKGYVEGVEGRRRRMDGVLSTLSLDD
ncbi:MAG: hypothetical protein GY731_05820 [Gammaproteobacteria bacterium]|nr:hypothetical protein [Gammaproteobacteria bacterium]